MRNACLALESQTVKFSMRWSAFFLKDLSEGANDYFVIKRSRSLECPLTPVLLPIG